MAPICPRSRVTSGVRVPLRQLGNAKGIQVSTDVGDLEAQARWADQIYKRCGYWTSLGSALATRGVVANLN